MIPTSPEDPREPTAAKKSAAGFDLRSVTWGYRDIFQQTIDDLQRQGSLGPDRQAVTATFFELLSRADQSSFDHVLREFLAALQPANRWILDLPALFEDFTKLGAALAEVKLHYGIRFFHTFAQGGMGESPRELRLCLDWLRRLRETDAELAMALLGGFATLRDRLEPREFEPFVEAAMQLYAHHPQNACRFLCCELDSAEATLRSITREARLEDLTGHLQGLLKALCDREIDVDDLSGLDSDDLLDRGTTVLAVDGHLYLPRRVRRFGSARQNRHWYLLAALAAAAMFQRGCFACIHGHPTYTTCRDLAGRGRLRVNLFIVLDLFRAMNHARRAWPGSRRLIDWALHDELAGMRDEGPMQLLAELFSESNGDPTLLSLRDLAEGCATCFDLVDRLGELDLQPLRRAWPRLDEIPFRPVGFLSDFLFPASFTHPPADQVVVDLKARSTGAQQSPPDDAPLSLDPQADGQGQTHADAEHPTAVQAAYLYDEWDFQQNTYRRDFCRVFEKPVEPVDTARPAEQWLEGARRVRSVFERLRPELARPETRLVHGDAINTDLLIGHIVDSLREPSPPVRFYEKPVIRHRDLATLILLDVSGSTGNETGGQRKVLDVEKHATLVLGQALDALDDRFAVCGFHSQGPEQCSFLLFKTFDEPFDDSVPRIASAWPRDSTRIGPALRHAGYLLGGQPHRQRLLLLITDGQPMDTGYDPHTRYAQHDVRMACEENARRDIHTLAISTRPNDLADMELMFPHRRFVLLPTLRDLPRILPELYLKLTR